VGLALATRSYWAVSFGLIAGCAVHCVLTHKLSRERWALRWDREAARQAWRYGAPLAPNGIAQGLKNIGDRLVVGAFLGPASLGLYSIAVMIGVMPRGIALRYVTTVFMPRFVNTGPGPQAAPLAAAFAVFVALLATALGLALWSLGKPFALLVFGPAYDPPLALIDAVAIMVAAKMLSAIVTMPAIAFGFTTFVLVGSAGSLAGIGLGALSLLIKPDLVLFVYIVALVDGLALAASLAIGGSRLSLSSLTAKLAAISPFIILGALAFLSSALPDLGWHWRLAVAIIVAASAGGVAVLLLRTGGSSSSETLRILREKPKAVRPPPADMD
jgi:PST family polysaccharide transporter